MTAAAGFLLAAQGQVDVARFLGMLVGLSFVIASGCVYNNYIDRGIDSKMERTRQRALVCGIISSQSALYFATILLIAGTVVLLVLTNLMTTAISLFGFIAYVAFYGYAKRRSSYGTLVGSISGALPPVIGYTAVSQQLDITAVVLFVILVCWQMPHFYAIAIYRSEDYRSADIPVLPLVRGVEATQQRILGYIGLYVLATASLTYFSPAGLTYGILTALSGFGWLMFGLSSLRKSDQVVWAKQMFGASLLTITIFCVTVSIDSFL